MHDVGDHLFGKNGFNATFTVTVPLNSSTCIKLDFLHRYSVINHRAPTQSVCNRFYFTVNVVDLPFASPKEIYR